MAKLGNSSSTSTSSTSTTLKLNAEYSSINVSSIIYQCKEQGAKQYQEDSTCIFYSPDLRLIVAGVFDGHGGLNGQVASKRVSKLTQEYFKKNWLKCLKWNNNQWTKNMINLFNDLHNKVRDEFIILEKKRREQNNLHLNKINDNGCVRKASGFPVHGGTTCTIVVLIREPKQWRIISANTGDSDALLLARKPSRLKSDNNKCKHLSVDHSPDNADEYLRIKNLDNKKYPTKLLFVYDQANTCRKFECPVVFLENGTKDPKYVNNPWGNKLRPTNVRYDPAVYAVSPYGISHDITCIAMTRSLGDFYAHQFGLSNVPSVTFNNLENNNNEYLITVGSDGIWDCWKWDDWSDYFNGVFTKNGTKLDTTTEICLKHTIQRAKACFGESSYDDASLVTIALINSLYKETNPEKKQKNNNLNNNDNDKNNNNNNNNNNIDNEYESKEKDINMSDDK